MKKIFIVFLILTILIVFLVLFKKRQFEFELKRQIDLVVKSNLNETSKLDSDIITKKDLDKLPKIVQKWLMSVGILGKRRIKYVTLSQKGKMKLKPEQKKRFYTKAKQYIDLDKLGYVWHVDIPILPLIDTKGVDVFYKGKGSMKVLIGYLFPIVDVKDNNKINESSLHRFLLELPWYPTGALQDYISWKEVNSQTAKAILTYGGYNVEVLFYFDEDGDLLKQKALRYKESDEKAKRIPCVGEVKGTTIVDGIKVPNKYNVSWYINDKEFTWYKLENYDIDFIY